MERQMFNSLYKNLAIIPFAGLFLTGCDAAVPSLDIPTQEIFADYSVDAYETNPSIAAAWFYTSKNIAKEPLDDIGMFNRTTVELTGGEMCEVLHEGDTYSMETFKDQTLDLKQDPRYWFLFSTTVTWYVISELSAYSMGAQMSTSFSSLATGEEVQFVFRRATGEELYSSVIIGEYPVITAPLTGAVIASGVDEFTVSWNALSDPAVPVQLIVAVRCSNQTASTGDEFIDLAALTYDAEHSYLGSLEASVAGGTTSYVVSRSELMKNVTVPAGLTECAGGVSIAYTSRGELAPEFNGGKIEVTHNSTKVDFKLKL